MPPRPAAVTGFLALNTVAAVTALDTTAPPARAAGMFARTGARIMLTDAAHRPVPKTSLSASTHP